MKKLSFVLASLFVVDLQAQQVTPLFRNDSLVTLVSIPFSLTDSSHAPLEITKLEVTSTAGKCKGYVDPFIPSNFFIKCTEPDTARAGVFFSQNGQTVKLNYGPVAVVAISERPIVLPKPPEPSTPDYSAGRSLYYDRIYSTNGGTYTGCVHCHREPSNLRNRTTTQINNAIRDKVPMQGIVLTTNQKQALSQYLSNLP